MWRPGRPTICRRCSLAVEISDAPTSAASMSKHSRHERVQCYGPRVHDPWQLRFQSSSYFVTEKPPDELPNVYLDPWSSCVQATTRRLTATRTCPCALDALQLPFCPIGRSLLYVHTYLSNYVDRVWTCHSPGPAHINSHPSSCIISFLSLGPFPPLASYPSQCVRRRRRSSVKKPHTHEIFVPPWIPRNLLRTSQGFFSR